MRKLPAYPLFVKDPFFSLWADSEILTEQDTVFWHGEPKPLYGQVVAEGKVYGFMGRQQHVTPLTQTALNLKAFSTLYHFTCSDFDLELEFLSPLTPNDLDLASCPVCFLKYTLTPKRPLGSIRITFSAEERLCYNTCFMPDRKENVRGGVLKYDGFESAYFGLRRQSPLSHSSDEIGADWGYYFIAGQDCEFFELGGMRYISASDKYESLKEKTSGKFLLAFDDMVSIFYYGEWLKGYYFRNGKTISDALCESYYGFNSIESACKEFDSILTQAAKPFGEDYLLLLYASLRQSMAAHKIVRDSKGRVLFLSKECNSDGCIATMDVSYASAPLYLLYNPELVNGMLYPIFDFARMPAWEYDFTPHDAGVYPYCIGQFYGALNQDNKYNSDIYMADWKKAENLPPFYVFPAGSKLYSFEMQMPLEECGNMLILTASAYLAGGGKKVITENFDMLEKWAKYLCENGKNPKKQLCTDDFAGHLDKNANLAIKASLGIAAFSIICNAIDKPKQADEYMKKAEEHARNWQDLCFLQGKNTPLSIGNKNDTFSIKYNLVFDKLFETSLYSTKLFEVEVNHYLEKQNIFGTPLDSRADYTKSDWLVWAAALSNDIDTSKKLILPLVKYLKESPNRVPFADLYDTKTAKNILFRNRPVQGGVFMLLLMASKKLSISDKKR